MFKKVYKKILRDYFAGKALEALISATVSKHDTNFDHNKCSDISYVIADAMIVSRNKKIELKPHSNLDNSDSVFEVTID